MDQPVLPDFDVPDVIDGFKGQFGFLSSFYECTLYVDGKRYGSLEHAYQAAKTSDPSTREVIRKAKTPSEAKKLGKSVQLPPDWDARKEGIVLDLVRKKFDNPFLGDMLVATDDAELVNTNTWGDRVWGVYRGSGTNLLGKALMKVREEMRREAK